MQYQRSAANETLKLRTEEYEESKKLSDQYATFKQHHSKQQEHAQSEVSRLDSLVKDNKDRQQKQTKETAQAVLTLIRDQAPPAARVADEELQKLRQDLNTSCEKVDILNKGQNAFFEAIQTQGIFRDKLKDLQESRTGSQDQLTALQKSTISLQDQLTEIKNQVKPSPDDSKKDIKTLKAGVEALELESKVSSTATKDLREQLQALEARLKQCDNDKTASIEKVEKELDSLNLAQENMINEIVKVVDGTSTPQTQIPEEVEARIRNLNSSFNTEVDLIRARVFRLETNSGEVKCTIDSFVKYAEWSKAQLKELENNQNVQQQQLGQQQEQHAKSHQLMQNSLQPQAAQAIDEVRKQLGGLREHVTALTNAVWTLDGRYNNLTTEPMVRAMTQVMFNMYPHARNVEKELVDLKRKISSLDSQVISLTSQLNGQVHLQGTAKEVEALGRDVVSLREQVNSRTQTQQQEYDVVVIRASITKVEKSVHELAEVSDRNALKDQANMNIMMDSKTRLENEIAALRRHFDEATEKIEESQQNETAKQTVLYLEVNSKIDQMKRELHEREKDRMRGRVVTPSSPDSRTNKENANHNDKEGVAFAEKNGILNVSMVENGHDNESNDDSDEDMPLKHRRDRERLLKAKYAASAQSSPSMPKDHASGLASVSVTAAAPTGSKSIGMALGRKQYLNKKRKLSHGPGSGGGRSSSPASGGGSSSTSEERGNSHSHSMSPSGKRY